MGLIKATLKTVCEKVNQIIYNREIRSAQKDAYKLLVKGLKVLTRIGIRSIRNDYSVANVKRATEETYALSL